MNPHLLETVMKCPRLPSPPARALQILELVRRPDTGLDEIAQVLKADPALAAKVLRTANSSLYAQRQQVTTVEQAVVMLGLNAVTTLALSFSLVRTGAAGVDLDGFWRRSVYAAAGARAAAAAVALPEIEEAFLGGLLTDLGVLALIQALGGEYLPLLARVEHAALSATERQTLGLDHAQVGAALAEHWKLPTIIIESIRWQDEPRRAPEPYRGLVMAVALGVHAADALLGSDPAAARSFFECAQAWFGLSRTAGEELLKSVSASGRDLAGFFDLKPRDPRNIDDILADANELLAEISMRTQIKAADLKQRQQQLAAEVNTDPLTGIGNRRAFDRFAGDHLGCSPRRPLSIVALDIDHFKRVNDKHGHATGDRVLDEIAKVLKSHTPAQAMSARTGGEEFAFALPGVTARAATELAEQVRLAIAAIVVATRDGPLSVTSSFGVATAAADREPPPLERLLAAADQALYAAKSAGRNCVRSDPTGSQPTTQPDA